LVRARERGKSGNERPRKRTLADRGRKAWAYIEEGGTTKKQRGEGRETMVFTLSGRKADSEGAGGNGITACGQGAAA